MATAINDIKVELGPVQETLLIPLLGRAKETHKTQGLVNDPKAVEIVDRLDYDFAKWNKIPSLVGSCIRTCMFDEEVSEFLNDHPEGTIVELGCGLNTRFERLDNGKATWIELDLPDAMELRRRFFKDQPRRKMIAASVLDKSWIDDVQATGGPYCFVSEAVIIYLNATNVESLVRRLVKHFPGSVLVSDTTSTEAVDSQHKHDALSKLSQDSWFRWACDEPEQLTAWGLELLRSRTFLDAQPDLMSRMPLSFRLVMQWAPWLIRRKVNGYRINRFALQGV